MPPSDIGASPKAKCPRDRDTVARLERRRHLATRLREQLNAGGSIDLLALFPNPPGDGKKHNRNSVEGYAKEFIYQVLHELLLDGIPLTVIAKKFRVDVRTVHLWKVRLFQRYREDARHIEAGILAGEVLENYRTMVAFGMRQLLDTSESDFPRRHAAILSVLKAQADMVEFMHLVGLIGTNPG